MVQSDWSRGMLCQLPTNFRLININFFDKNKLKLIINIKTLNVYIEKDRKLG